MKAQKSNKRKPDTISVGNVVVKIYNRNRTTITGSKRTIWEVADYTSGTRRLQSFSNFADAKAEAQRIARLLSTGDATAASFSGTDAASYGRAVEILRSYGLDIPLELATAHYAEAVKILGADRVVEAARDFIRRNPTERPPRTLRDVANELVELKTNRKASARYIEDLKLRLSKLADKFTVNVDRRQNHRAHFARSYCRQL